MSSVEVVITGMGVVSPYGVGQDALWQGVVSGQSAVRPITEFDTRGLPLRMVARVPDFDPKQFVQPRKSLKIMCPDMTYAVACARMAMEQAELTDQGVEPERLGVVLGADPITPPTGSWQENFYGCRGSDGKIVLARWWENMSRSFPLGFLATLPNMAACHASISINAQGHNNTLHQGEVSSLMAIAEAASVIERGWADVVVAGGASSMLEPFDLARMCALDEVSRRNGDGGGTPRPFDAERDGQVRGEGAAVFVLERREFAEARGANILARLLGCGAGCDGRRHDDRVPGMAAVTGQGIRAAIKAALNRARLTGREIGHVNAHGLATRCDDRREAEAIAELVGDAPVTAPKSYFGNLCAAGGAVEMAVSVLALQEGIVPPVLNCQRPADDCPINVVHGQAAKAAHPTALLLNHTRFGQAAAMVLAAG